MWLWLAAFGLLIASMVGSALMILRPAAVSQPFLVEHALEPTQPITRAQRRKVREIYETAGRARMDAAHATALLAPRSHPHVDLLELDISASGQTSLRLSLRRGASWMNIEFEGTVELANGRVKRCEADMLRVSGWDLTEEVRGLDLSLAAEEQLAPERAAAPEWAALLEGMDRFWLEDGHFYAVRD